MDGPLLTFVIAAAVFACYRVFSLHASRPGVGVFLHGMMIGWASVSVAFCVVNVLLTYTTTDYAAGWWYSMCALAGVISAGLALGISGIWWRSIPGGLKLWFPVLIHCIASAIWLRIIADWPAWNWI